MNIHSQFELFPKKTDQFSLEPARNRYQIKDLTLSVENIIVLCIILVMTCVLFFSFGVERGRRLVLNAQLQMDAALMAPVATEITGDAVPAEVAAPDQAVSTNIPVESSEEIIQIPIEKALSDAELYTIQVASYKKDSDAQKEGKRLQENGYETYVLAKGNYSILCVGKFEDKEQAKQFSKKLKPKYTDLLVRRF